VKTIYLLGIAALLFNCSPAKDEQKRVPNLRLTPHQPLRLVLPSKKNTRLLQHIILILFSSASTTTAVC
jgi:hypothetical protein